jgi:ATP-dependent Clp protease adaptor protein ClpS
MVLQVSGQYSGAYVMADQNKSPFHDDNEFSDTLPADGREPKAKAGQSAPRLLPPWKVLLHNDDLNAMDKVVEIIYTLTPLNREQALARMQEAHNAGSALLLVTHRERAELYVEQFQSCRLTVTIEPVG